MERAQRRGWAPVVLDLGVDTTTPVGELIASVMISVSQWERRAISQRTTEALAVKKAQGVDFWEAALTSAGDAQSHGQDEEAWEDVPRDRGHLEW